jgi:hypothetical protein
LPQQLAAGQQLLVELCLHSSSLGSITEAQQAAQGQQGRGRQGLLQEVTYRLPLAGVA